MGQIRPIDYVCRCVTLATCRDIFEDLRMVRFDDDIDDDDDDPDDEDEDDEDDENDEDDEEDDEDDEDEPETWQVSGAHPSRKKLAPLDFGFRTA